MISKCVIRIERNSVGEYYALSRVWMRMVHVCVIPESSNRCHSDRETHLSYFHLPLKNKRLRDETNYL